jgi:hypothetical protein
MKTKYYLFGGQVAAPAYRWKGYTLPGLTRNAAETRGLSGDPETEFLPYRASGPEMLDPGEGGTLAGITDILKTSVLGVPVVPIALAAGAAWWLFGRKKMRKNPGKKGSGFYVSTYCNFPHSKKTGRPIGHECRIIPPSALKAEMEDDFPKAIDILSKSSKRTVKGR